MARATSLSAASCCTLWDAPTELRRVKEPSAATRPRAPLLSFFVSRVAASKPTKPKAAKMALLMPSAAVAEVT
jgi:hypothetical protein